MSRKSVVGEHEALRRALRWLGEHPPVTVDRVSEAACRFDLSPLDEDFLLREFAAQGSKNSSLQDSNT